MTPIEVVNAYRELTGSTLSFKKAEHGATRYIGWCERNGVDPLRFMKARVHLAKEGARTIPPISALPSKALLVDDAWLEIVDRAEGLEQDAKFSAAELAKCHDIYIATLVAATPAQEKFKAAHKDKPATCQADAQFSGGYHPHSIHCQNCTIAGACAQALNREHGFDVVMLRLNKGYIGYVIVA